MRQNLKERAIGNEIRSFALFSLAFSEFDVGMVGCLRK